MMKEFYILMKEHAQENPREPWYETVRKVASLILLERIETSSFLPETAIDGWPELVEVLEQHGKHLMLPENVESPVDVVPKEIQHKLWLQSFCFAELIAIGQDNDSICLAMMDLHTIMKLLAELFILNLRMLIS